MIVLPPEDRSPVRIIYFEDLEAGRRLELGTIEISASDIINFARDYDPQPFHLDEGAALTASGWQIGAMGMRLLCEALLLGSRSKISPGIEEMRWLRPVYPGDVLTGHVVVEQLRLSNSNPAMGIVSLTIGLDGPGGTGVMRSRQNVFWERDPQGAMSPPGGETDP